MLSLIIKDTLICRATRNTAVKCRNFLPTLAYVVDNCDTTVIRTNISVLGAQDLTSAPITTAEMMQKLTAAFSFAH